MTRIQQTFGYATAFLSIIVAVATLADNGMIGSLLVRHLHLVVSPNMYGGEIHRTIRRNGYRVVIHEPVFQGLFQQKSEGFIQVDIFTDVSAPEFIHENIGIDDDATVDFSISYDSVTKKVDIHSFNPHVTTRFQTTKRQSGCSVRLHATNPL